MAFWRKKQTLPAITVEPQEKEIRPRVNALGERESENYSKRYAAALEKSFQRTHAALKMFTPEGDKIAMDGNFKTAMDNNIQQVKSYTAANQGFIPLPVLEWFSGQGFIGWQICAILMQNWLINKACKMPGQDAVRNGFERSVNKSVTVPPAVFDELREWDEFFKLKDNLVEHSKFARGFGLRHTLFIVDGIDYEAPFNPDGVKKGAYKGMTQIDPYWLAPMFSIEDASNPISQNFYNPTWWMLNGKKIHRTHFVISRNGNDLADLLKPSYFYGGLSTAQMIYERVYAAERSANEGPLLLMTKRLYTLMTDTVKAMNNLEAFRAQLTEWMAFINNFGVKVLGIDEKIEQIETTLAGVTEITDQQYGIAAAIAEVPSAKLMGTSPKGGLGSEGTYDTKSYQEFLKSLQSDELNPIVQRHTLLVQCSEMPETKAIRFQTQWLPTDMPTAKELSEINLNKANTDNALVTAGAIDGLDVRRRLITDRDSGYNGIEEEVEGMTMADNEGEPEGGGDDDNAE